RPRRNGGVGRSVPAPFGRLPGCFLRFIGQSFSEGLLTDSGGCKSIYSGGVAPMLPLTLVLAWSVTVQEAQVACLIKQLGDERYAVRAAAHTALERILLSDYGHLHRTRVEAAMRNRDLEIARRAELLVEDFYNIRPSHYPVLPWIDMLPPSRADRQAIID